MSITGKLLATVLNCFYIRNVRCTSKWKMSDVNRSTADKFQPARNNNKQYIITSIWPYYATNTEETTDKLHTVVLHVCIEYKTKTK